MRAMYLASAALAALNGAANFAADSATAFSGVLSNVSPSSVEDLLLRRMTTGRSHSRGHAGQFDKDIERRRMRNKMRRHTRQMQRTAA